MELREMQETLRRLSPDQKANVALALSLYAVTVGARKPRRKSIGERLWDLI